MITLGDLVTTLRTDIINERADEYAAAIHVSGAHRTSFVGFFDGIRIRCCKHGGNAANQRSVYSGHNRVHCLPYLYLTIPNGLIYSYSVLWKGDSSTQYCTPDST